MTTEIINPVNPKLDRFMITKIKSIEMIDVQHGLQYAVQLKGGLLNIILGVIGTLFIDLSIDVSALLAAIPAFLGTLSAVAVGTWYSIKNKQADIDEKNIKLMDKLIENGTITKDMNPDERIAILKKVRAAA
jgi:hypothetical protein